MPPKPRPIRKSSSAPRDASTTIPPSLTKDASAPSMSMPPPPDPLPPLGILEAEVTALSSCLQNAVVKTGQVFGFYADVKRLGIEQYATRPPRSLMSSLGREIVKYDQLCDAVESHLLRAITVLQRDLAREEQRLKAQEEAVAAVAKASSPSAVMGTTPPGSPQSAQPPETLPDGKTHPRQSGVSVPSARRQSTISLSSLSRPAFPHKLDLSASALRINPEEMMIPSGISSPVTLAPRSARAPSLPPELVMAALSDAANRPVDIDLTVDSDIGMSGPSGSSGQVRSIVPMDPALGSSADKPIELDIDIDMEFFGDGSGSGAGSANAIMFGPHLPSHHADIIKPKVEEGHMDMDLLNAFNSVAPSGNGEDIFASLSEPAPGAAGAPSATAASQPGDAAGAAAPFDFDISTLGSNFFNGPSAGNEMNMMGMDDIFSIGVNPPPSNNTTS